MKRLAAVLALLSPAAAAQTDLPRLSGVIVSFSTRVALFEDAPGRLVSAGEGEEVAGYAVRSIARGRVELERGGQRFTLELSGGTAPPAQVDTGGVTFGLRVNPKEPAPD